MNRKIAFALSLLGISASAFAGHVGDQVVAPVGVNLVAPDTVGVWSFGAEILLMQPSSNFQYGQFQTTDVDAGTNHYQNNQVKRSYTLGGTIDAAYLFPGNARDIKIAFTNIDMNDSSHKTIIGQDDDQIYIPPFNNMANLTGSASTINGKEEDDYVSADMVFGQWFRIGERVDLHPFGGLRYADIDENGYGYYYDTNTSVTQASKVRSEFQGIGPRAGIDTAVHLGWGISIVGTVGGSLLVGDIDSKVNASNPGATSNENYTNGGHTTAVPEVDARIGVNYLYNYTETSSMSVEAGFQDVNYFNVNDMDYLDSSVPNTVLNSNNFSYNGWYVRFQLNFA